MAVSRTQCVSSGRDRNIETDMATMPSSQCNHNSLRQYTVPLELMRFPRIVRLQPPLFASKIGNIAASPPQGVFQLSISTSLSGACKIKRSCFMFPSARLGRWQWHLRRQSFNKPEARSSGYTTFKHFKSQRPMSMRGTPMSILLAANPCATLRPR